MKEIRATNCHYCGYLCALKATVEEGRVVDIEPDVTRFPYDERIVRQCRRWHMNLSDLDADDRINYPLRRVGERGSGKFERVTWEEALDDIEMRLRALINEHGARTLASAIGGPHASFWPLHRFMNLLGSPNNMGIGQICWNPRIWMDAVTFGWTIEADITPSITETLFIWGTNPAQSDNSAFWRSLIALSKTEVNLVVVDPRFTQTARLASLWLPIRPGTDCDLALGLLHVIIKNGWQDHDFVDTWCHGFHELEEAVGGYTPEVVSSICGVPAADIVEAARLFAQASAAALVSGRGIDQSGAAVAPTHRAIACLRAVTGNLDKPGACVITESSDFTPEVDLEMSVSISDECRAACLNTAITPLQSYDGCDAMAKLTGKHGNYLPVRYLASAHPELVWKAVLEGDPYPIRALIIEATNPLITYADTPLVHKALHALDLVVALEYRLTPTAALADYVLPIAGAVERPVFQAHGGVANIVYGGPAAIEPYYERRTDYDVFRELGIRFGQEDHWPCETMQEAFAATLADIPMSWEDFCQIGIYAPQSRFFKYLEQTETGEMRGFATITGKVELASEFLHQLGGARVPQAHTKPLLLDQKNCNSSSKHASYQAQQNTLSKDKAEEEGIELILVTGARKQPYNASMYLQNPEFRKRYPHPLAEISETTAARLQVSQGDEVLVSTNKGEAQFVVDIIAMRDDVISVDYGWWFPELTLEEPELGGYKRSNVNMLTSSSLEDAEPLIGTWSYNAILCNVRVLDQSL